MSKAMTPNQAQELTSLAATDRLLATDANGNLRRISRDNLVNQNRLADTLYADSNNRWTRVASWYNNDAASAIICLTAGYWSGNPKGQILALTHRYELTPYIRLILGDSLRVRVVRQDQYFYLDVYCHTRRMVSAVSGFGVTPMAEQGPTTDGCTVLLDKSLPSVSGGVKRCSTAHWKGGAPHEQSDNITRLPQVAALLLRLIRKVRPPHRHRRCHEQAKQ